MKRWAKSIKSQQAFTIIEMLVVVVVIGILAAILIVGYGAVQNNARDTSVKSDLTAFANVVKLKALDDEVVPPGGATSSLIGDSTQLPGINVKPTGGAYDTSLNNLFYCSGDIGGTHEFAFAAKSITGKVFSYLSNGGVSEVTGTYVWDYNGICTKLGFSDPFTWSYGYNPAPIYLWFSWAE